VSGPIADSLLSRLIISARLRLVPVAKRSATVLVSRPVFGHDWVSCRLCPCACSPALCILSRLYLALFRSRQLIDGGGGYNQGAQGGYGGAFGVIIGSNKLILLYLGGQGGYGGGGQY